MTASVSGGSRRSSPGRSGRSAGLFGPEKISGYLGEFLGYFMVRKVFAGHMLEDEAAVASGNPGRLTRVASLRQRSPRRQSGRLRACHTAGRQQTS